jgi:hypothetical protein
MLARAGSGNGVSVAEVEWRGSPGGADLCVGGTPSGDSTGGFVAANAFDNDNATYFYNGATGGVCARLSYDFGSSVTPAELWLRNAPAGTHNGLQYGPAHVRVEWSDDGTTWITGSTAFNASVLGTDEEITVGGISDAPPSGLLIEIPAPLITFAPTWPVTPLVFDVALLATRPDYGGYGRIAGDVMIKGTPDAPVRRIVRLVREIDAVCVAQQWSDPITGAYEFLGFDPAQLYTVLAYDELGGYRAAIASNVVPEPMIV